MPDRSAPSPTAPDPLADPPPPSPRAAADPDELAVLRAENAELRAANTQLRAAIAELATDELRQVAVHWNPEGCITAWSSEAEQLFGWSAAEAQGRSLLGLLAAVDAETEAILRALILAGRLGESCGQVHSKSGEVRRYKWRNVLQFDPQGVCQAVCSYLTELSGKSAPISRLRADAMLMQTILDNLQSIIFVKAPDGHYLFTSQHLERMYGTSRERILRGTDYDFWPKEVAAAMRQKDDEVAAGRQLVQFEETIPQPDGTHTIATLKFPVFDMNGQCLGVCGVATDVTDRKRAEQERNALQQQVIAAQEAALRELSTPLIPVADGLIVMPLVGTLDPARARQILDSLLHGIVEQRSRLVILDITGVRAVDAQVAATLVQASSAARLLGVQVLLTGISAAMAQVLVTLQTDLSSIVTLSTLQSGIAYALKQIQK